MRAPAVVSRSLKSQAAAAAALIAIAVEAKADLVTRRIGDPEMQIAVVGDLELDTASFELRDEQSDFFARAQQLAQPVAVTFTARGKPDEVAVEERYRDELHAELIHFANPAFGVADATVGHCPALNGTCHKIVLPLMVWMRGIGLQTGH